MYTEQWGNGMVLFWKICTENVLRSTPVKIVLELFLFVLHQKSELLSFRMQPFV